MRPWSASTRYARPSGRCANAKSFSHSQCALPRSGTLADTSGSVGNSANARLVPSAQSAHARAAYASLETREQLESIPARRPDHALIETERPREVERVDVVLLVAQILPPHRELVFLVCGDIAEASVEQRVPALARDRLILDVEKMLAFVNAVGLNVPPAATDGLAVAYEPCHVGARREDHPAVL